MINIIGFFIISICLIYVLRQINIKPCKGIVFFIKFTLPFMFGIQFFSIFQYGNETAGIPVRIAFLENVTIQCLNLPNPIIQWLSFIFCMLIVFCI